MQHQVIIDAGDIDEIVKTVPQAKIIGDIRLCIRALSGELTDALRFYWRDKCKAYCLAYDIATWYGKDLVTPELTLQAQNEQLLQKLYDRVVPKVKVQGGIPYG